MRTELAYAPEFTAALARAIAGRKFVLASNSPRRADILTRLGVSFEKSLPAVDESVNNSASPEEHALVLAERKAHSVSRGRRAVVVGADTIVVLGSEILGKPSDPEHAVQMLSKLSGQAHRVITAVALRDLATDESASGLSESRVHFRRLTADEIRAYAASEEASDKAGSYAVQGLGGSFIQSYEGDLDNIIGFPARLFLALLKQISGEA